MNGQLALQEGGALAHAGQTETLPSTAFGIETHAGVRDLQHQIFRIACQPDFGVPGVAVPDDIVQRLLRNPIEAERHVRFDVLRYDIALEHDVDGALARDVSAQELKGIDEPQGLQLRGVQLVRQIVNVRGNLAGSIGELAESGLLAGSVAASWSIPIARSAIFWLTSS